MSKKNHKVSETANAKALRDLFSSNDEVVIKAIKQLAETGDYQVVYPLLELLLNGSEEVAAHVEHTLFQLKDTKAMQELVNALDNPKYLSVRSTILAAFWNTGQWPTEHLTKLCEIAISGTFQEAFEVLTIVEHMEGNLEPAELEQALELLREYLMQQEGHDNFAIVETIHSALDTAQDV